MMELIVGNHYQHKKHLWVIELLHIGKKNVFVYHYLMKTECSYPIEMILKEFRDCTLEVSDAEH